jgi:beta-lactamase regulating signal transducer with metallopeptidase domain
MSGWTIGWLSRNESIALGWTLLHFCWQGAAVVAAYALADRLTMRASSVVRYAVAAGALALMPLMVLATFAAEMRTAPPVHTNPNASREFTASLGRGIEEPVSQSNPTLLVSMAGAQGSWLANDTERILPWLDALWMLGVLLLAVRTMGGWRQLERLRRQASGIVPAHIEQSFLLICERVQVGRRVMLRVSDQVISPMAMGVWRATVILPISAVLSLTTEELEAVLAHELGHIRRWDYAFNLLQTALETVLFFHPAVWWLSRKVRDRREVCCDEIAVQSCADPVVYAQTLLRLEEQKLTGMRLAVAQRGSRGSLLGRIKKVLEEDEPMESGITGGVRVAVAGLVVFGLLFGPKVGDAVAASRPAVDHATALTSDAASPKPATSSTKAAASPTSGNRIATAKAAPSTRSQTDTGTVEVASLRSAAQASVGLAMMQAESKSESRPESKGLSYIDGMRDAGYPLDLNNDLNTLISLKSLGVTPEYAKQMGALGFGKPTVHELISLKALGVTPEYVAELKQSGLGPKDFHEVTTEKALGITLEYSAEMKKTGFGELNLQELISLKAQNVTPEYVSWLKQQFPQITLDQLRQAAVFHLDDKFLAQAKSHGFDGKDLEKLLRLKISGLLDE